MPVIGGLLFYYFLYFDFSFASILLLNGFWLDYFSIYLSMYLVDFIEILLNCETVCINLFDKVEGSS